MFNNIGKKIKTLVMVVFVIGCIGAVITMVSIWLNIPNVSHYNGGTGILLFFGGLLAGILAFLLSWIGSFFLYGYGELIDSCQSMADDIKQIKSQMSPNNSAPSFLHGNESNTINISTSTTETSNFRAQALGLWTCKNCGCENSGDSLFCTSCGERK